MEESYSKLAALRSQPMPGQGPGVSYGQKFGSFFEEMSSLTSPLLTLSAFEASLIRTLFPIAPYLIKVINLNQEDLDLIETSQDKTTKDDDDNSGEDNTERRREKSESDSEEALIAQTPTKLPALVPVNYL